MICNTSLKRKAPVDGASARRCRHLPLDRAARIVGLGLLGEFGRESRRQIQPIVRQSISTISASSSQVVIRPRLKRIAPMPTSGETPIARSSGESSTMPPLQQKAGENPDRQDVQRPIPIPISRAWVNMAWCMRLWSKMVSSTCLVFSSSAFRISQTYRGMRSASKAWPI